MRQRLPFSLSPCLSRRIGAIARELTGFIWAIARHVPVTTG
jgi:hypothetical protein